MAPEVKYNFIRIRNSSDFKITRVELYPGGKATIERDLEGKFNMTEVRILETLRTAYEVSKSQAENKSAPPDEVLDWATRVRELTAYE